MSDLLGGENRRVTEMNTDELETVLWEDAMRPETEPEDVDALFEVMQELAARQPQSEAVDTGKAYAAFKTHYAPGTESEESLYAQPKKEKPGVDRLRLLTALQAAAAVAAIVLLGTLVLRWLGLGLGDGNILIGTPGTSQSTQSGEEPEISMQDVVWAKTVIVDAYGNITGTGTVLVDRYSVTASVSPAEAAMDQYDYTVSVDYTYYTEESRGPDDYQGAVYKDVALSPEGITMIPKGQNGSIRSATVTFRAAEKSGSSDAVSETLTVVSPFEQ